MGCLCLRYCTSKPVGIHEVGKEQQPIPTHTREEGFKYGRLTS